MVSGVFLALGSNICLALRNTFTKYFNFGEQSQKSRTTLEGFAVISLAGLISLLPLHIYLLASTNFLSSYSYALIPLKVNEYIAGIEIV